MDESDIADRARLAYARMLKDGFERDILECERNQQGWIDRGISKLSTQYLHEISIGIELYRQIIWRLIHDIEIYEERIREREAASAGKACRYCGKEACWECTKEGDFEADEETA